MPDNDTLAIFLRKFAEVAPSLQAADLSGETRYRELPVWDSLTMLSLLAILEEDYAVVLEAKDLRAHTTLAELHQFVLRRRQTAAASAPPTTHRNA